MIPPVRVPLIRENGMISHEWFVFFDKLAKGYVEHKADADAAPDTTYYSTTANKLVFKNDAGVVNALY